MKDDRIVGFSDATFAIIITIMVLEVKMPHGFELHDLLAISKVLISYIISFIFVGIFWVNHHHLFHVIKHVNDKILWANLSLLFWLSVLPFATGWLGESDFNYTVPIVTYAIVIFLAKMSFRIMLLIIKKNEGEEAAIVSEFAGNKKGLITGCINFLAIIVGFVSPITSFILLVIVALAWMAPGKMVNRILENKG